MKKKELKRIFGRYPEFYMWVRESKERVDQLKEDRNKVHHLYKEWLRDKNRMKIEQFMKITEAVSEAVTHLQTMTETMQKNLNRK